MNINYFTGFDSMLEDGKLTAVLEDFIDNLPHGSGIDCDWEGHMPDSGKYVYFRNSYHCMDEYGYYEGYQDFTVRIPKIDFINFVYGSWFMSMSMTSDLVTEAKNMWGDATISIIDEFTVQFNGGHYLADKHMLKDYLDDTFAWALRDYFNSLV